GLSGGCGGRARPADRFRGPPGGSAEAARPSLVHRAFSTDRSPQGACSLCRRPPPLPNVDGMDALPALALLAALLLLFVPPLVAAPGRRRARTAPSRTTPAGGRRDLDSPHERVRAGTGRKGSADRLRRGRAGAWRRRLTGGGPAPAGRAPLIVFAGGGASATLAAVALLRATTWLRLEYRVLIADEHGRHGRGAALARPGRLDAPARLMSALPDRPAHLRSEEHTSELQSRRKLVCR